jgi:hypothetical protein
MMGTLYRVTAPYVTLRQDTALGPRLIGFGEGAVVDGDAVPDWQLRHHLDGGMIEEVEDPAAVPEPVPGSGAAPADGEGPDGEASAGEFQSRPSAPEVRAWALANDLDVSSSGPVPAHIWQAYADAHH